MDLDLEAWVHGAWASASMDLDLEAWGRRARSRHEHGHRTERA